MTDEVDELSDFGVFELDDDGVLFELSELLLELELLEDEAVVDE